MLASSRSSAFGTLFQLSQRWVGSQYSTATSALEPLEPLEPLDSYGMSNFDYIRMNDLWYVDKTRFIPIVEKLGQQLFFVRPPRFGKTLFLSTMWSYYDIAQADYFDDLFKGLDIHRNPTSLRNAFHVLHFDLSNIDTTSGDPAEISRFFRKSINSSIKECCLQYKLDPSDIVDPEDSSDSLRNLALKFQGKNLMVLIDEYDRFANTLMFENPGAYDKIVRGTSGDPLSSPLRSFLTNLKSLTSRFRFNRFRSFITGITPLALADTSGYNVAENVSLNKRLGDLTGFTDDDMRQALRDIVMLSKEEEQKQALAVLRRNINGYCFPGSTTSLYNSTLATFCLKKMAQDQDFLQRVLSGNIDWENLLDTNVKTSDRVLSLALKVPSSSEIVLRLSNVALATTAKIQPVFTLHQMLHPELHDRKARDRALSFMYYQGAVTLTKGDQDTESPVHLRIPNELARGDFLDRLRTELALPERLLMEMFESPSEATVYNLLSEITEKQQTLFDNTVSEAGLQHAIEAALRAQTSRGLTIIEAEMELDEGRRRCDMALLDEDGNTIVLEFKRVRPNALDLDSTDPEIKSLDLPDNNWHPPHYERLAKYIKTRTPEQLQQLRIKKDRRGMYGHCKTVGELHDKAQEQLGGYLTAVSKLPVVEKVFGFVVMQIAKPLTVHKYKPPLVQDEWGKRPL